MKVAAAGYFAAIGAISIYAGMFAVGRAGAAAGLDGYDQTALRFAVAAVAILPFGIAGFGGIIRRVGPGRSVILAILNGATYSAVFLGGLTFAPVAYGAMIVPGLQPFVVMLLTYLVLGQKPVRWALAGNCICLAGLVVVLLVQRDGAQPGLVIGIGLFLCAAAMWGSFAFYLRQWNVLPKDALIIIGSISPIIFLPLYFALRGATALSTSAPAILLQIVYQGLLVGIVAVFLYPFAIKKLGSTQVAALSPGMPVLATLVGILFLKEYPALWQWTGLTIVTFGLAVSQIGPRIRFFHNKTGSGN